MSYPVYPIDPIVVPEAHILDTGHADLVEYFALALAVWFLTWGLNRIYLMFKSILH